MRLGWAAAAVLVCVALGSTRPLAPLRIGTASAETRRTPGELAQTSCPSGTVPDGDVCVHVTDLTDDGPEAPAQANTHRERSGQWTHYEQIPRLPERPADYDVYRYPIPPGLAGGHYVVSGYDLDKPDEAQRRGRTLKHVGHGGVDLPQTKGTPIKLVTLEHQEGPAEVLYTGPHFGTTVITRHTLREGGRTRDYIVIFGHMDSIAAGIAPGTALNDGDVVGTVGDTGSPRIVHLHLEIRRVRDGIDVGKIPAGAQLLAENVTVVCDPRNVLPLK